MAEITKISYSRGSCRVYYLLGEFGNSFSFNRKSGMFRDMGMEEGKHLVRFYNKELLIDEGLYIEFMGWYL